jgi:hypothetical protein
MMESVSVPAHRISFRKMFRRILWQGFLFLLVLAIAISMMIWGNIPGFLNVPVFIFVLGADAIVFIFQVRKIIDNNGEIKITCTLSEAGLEEKNNQTDEIRMLPFSVIRGYSLGKINLEEEENYFRIRLKKTSEEIYMSTLEMSKDLFFNFTESFLKSAEQFNEALPSGTAKIKKLK